MASEVKTEAGLVRHGRQEEQLKRDSGDTLKRTDTIQVRIPGRDKPVAYIPAVVIAPGARQKDEIPISKLNLWRFRGRLQSIKGLKVVGRLFYLDFENEETIYEIVTKENFEDAIVDMKVRGPTEDGKYTFYLPHYYQIFSDAARKTAEAVRNDQVDRQRRRGTGERLLQDTGHVSKKRAWSHAFVGPTEDAGDRGC